MSDEMETSIFESIRNSLTSLITHCEVLKCANSFFLSAAYGIIFLVGYGIVSFVLYRIIVGYMNGIGRADLLRSGKRILFIISHPDDECMFFGPAIIKLLLNHNVYLMCLSYGDYNGQGYIRKQELWDSCTKLGIPQSNIIIYNVSVLKDHPTNKWDEKTIMKIILDYVESLRIDKVVTFDRFGVSGHSNHKSIYYALARLTLTNSFPHYCKIFCLDSISTFRKYTYVFDLLWSCFVDSNLFVLNSIENTTVKSAMKCHESQVVWFRKLYIRVSRYCYINTYTVMKHEMALMDIELRKMLDYSKTYENVQDV